MSKKAVKRALAELMDNHKIQKKIVHLENNSNIQVKSRIRILCNKFINLICLKLFPSRLKNFLIGLTGVNILKDVCIPNCVYFDPYFPELITIEEGVLLGSYTKILAHEIKHNKLILGKIRFKKRSLVSALNVILPGGTIEKNSILGHASQLSSTIPSGELWAGVPAKRVKRFSKDDIEKYFFPSRDLSKYNVETRQQIKSFINSKDRDLRIKYDGSRSNAGCDWYRVRNVFRILLNSVVIEITRFLPTCFFKNYLYKLIGVKIGRKVKIGYGTILEYIFPELVVIGDNSKIGKNVRLGCHEFAISFSRFARTTIGHNVTIRDNVLIRTGSFIGDNSVIESNSAVASDVPNDEAWAGFPARFIQRNDDLYYPINFRNFYEMFKYKSKKNKDKIYLIDAIKDKKISYEKCDKISNQIANFLVSKGLTSSDTISTLLGNTIEYVYIMIAAFKVGVRFNPLNPKLGDKVNNQMLKYVSPKLIICGQDSNGGKRIDINFLFNSLNKFSDIYKDTFQPNLDSDMLLLYTSGTTGEPKGIILTQKNVLANTISAAKMVNPKGTKVIFDLLPLTFSGGIIPGLLAPIYFNGTSIITNKFSKDNFWKIVDKYRANYIYGVPTIFNVLLASDISKYDLSCIDFFINSSASLTTDLLLNFKKKFQVPIYDVYGLSETLGITVQMANEGGITNHSIGKPMDVNKVKIFGERGNELAYGEVGEIVVKGPNVMKGYFRGLRETKEIIKNGWFYTGDLGYTDSHQNFYIVGRKKEIIIKGGMNISPKEINDALHIHKDVSDSATIGIPDEKYGEEIVCFVVLKKNSNVTNKELMDFTQKHLIKFKIPKYIRVVDRIPRTHLGKIIKNDLIELINL